MTTENNKLIAEFMGLQTITFDKTMYLLKWKNNLVQPKDDTIFKFDSDWNWLMEVVEKIEDLSYSLEINKQEENDYQCIIVKKDIIVQTFSSKKIEAVYNACLEFIKWYNEQKR
jgi:hypothetical protein